MVKKLGGWVAGVLIAVWITSDPGGAGDNVHTWISDILTFLTHLAHG